MVMEESWPALPFRVTSVHRFVSAQSSESLTTILQLGSNLFSPVPMFQEFTVNNYNILIQVITPPPPFFDVCVLIFRI